MANQVKRLQKELVAIMADPVPYAEVQIGDDLTVWNCILTGPPNTVFKGGKFKFTISFTPEFPFKAPIVKFKTKIYHPNFDDEGSICIGILKSESWKPALKLNVVIAAIVQLLVNPIPDDPLDTSIAEQFKTNRAEFDKIAKEWVKKYAS